MQFPLGVQMWKKRQWSSNFCGTLDPSDGFSGQTRPPGALIPKAHCVLVQQGWRPKACWVAAVWVMTWRPTKCLLICLTSSQSIISSFNFFFFINFSLLAYPFLFQSSFWSYGQICMTCCGLFTLLSLTIQQAMYQLAPDEKRRDCGLNVLDTYFNNGVRGWLHVRAGAPASADTMSHF